MVCGEMLSSTLMSVLLFICSSIAQEKIYKILFVKLFFFLVFADYL